MNDKSTDMLNEIVSGSSAMIDKVYPTMRVLLKPKGFSDSDIKRIAEKFLGDYQDLKYMHVLHDLNKTWEMNEQTAKRLYQLVQSLGVI